MIHFFLILSLISIVIVTCGFIIGTAIDDFRDVQRRHRITKHPHSRSYRAHPLVTILLVAGDNIDDTKKALEAIRKNSYRHLECIIIGSLQNRAKLKNIAHSSTNSTRPISIFTGKKSEQTNLDGAYRRYGHGDIVLILRDTDRLHDSAIQCSVWHFNTRPNTLRLRARITIATRYSNIGTLQTYTEALTYFWNKFTNSLEHACEPDNSSVLFCRAHAFLNRHATSRAATYSAEDVIVNRSAATARDFIMHIHAAMRQQATTLTSLHYFTDQNSSKNAMLKWLFALFIASAIYVSIVLPFLLSYFIFLAFIPHQPALLFVALGILSIYILLGLWSHQGMSRLRKIRLSLFIPAYFMPFFALVIVFSVVITITIARTAWTSVSKRTALRRKISFR